MKRWAIAAGVVAALVLAAEIVAVPVASRVLGSSLGRCLEHEDLAVDRVRRPVVPRLAVGRARDVSLRVDGLVVGGLRIDEVRADLPDVRLPWAPGGAVQTEATLELTIGADDLEDWLGAHAPLGLRPSLVLEPDAATVGLGDLPVRVSLDASVTDGVLTVRPSGDDEALWATLGLAAELDLPDDVRVDRLVLDTGRVTSTVRVDVVPGLSDGSGDCVGPFVSAGR